MTPQRAECGRTVARLSHADSARSMLTLRSACRRTMRGRIFEYKNMAHIGVDSANRAYDSPAGRARAREALAPALRSRGARRAWRQGGAGHVFGQLCAYGAAQASLLACYVMYDVRMGPRYLSKFQSQLR